MHMIKKIIIEENNKNTSLIQLKPCWFDKYFN